MGLEDGSRQVTILSIDGGGVHGVVPAVLLQSLEKYLQEEIEKEGGKNVKVRIADYFDVIAGTGIGSLIAGLLCKAPEPSNMSDILTTLEDISQHVFPNDNQKGYFERMRWTLSAGWSLAKSFMTGLITTGNPFLFIESYWKRSWEEQKNPISQFSNKLDDCFGDTQLHQTLTNLIVPAYHFNSARPMLFSSYAYSKAEKGGISLKDVVLGSSATPTVLPFHDIEEKNYMGLTGTFADGSIIANNPSMLAIQEAAIIYGSEERFKNYMVLSLGTVRREIPKYMFQSRYDLAKSIARQIVEHMTSFLIWTDLVAGCLQYIYIFFNAITELYMSRLFPQTQLSHFSSNYLRLRAHVELSEAVPSILNGSKEAFDKLKDIAHHHILNHTATVIHPNTGALLEQNFTNQQALQEFARRLHKQKQIKDQIKFKNGKPSL